MNKAYADWILENVTRSYGTCAETTLAMVKAFPELIRVRGHYYDLVWGEREHWWCVAPNGDIVDPTASQFPTAGAGHYEASDESQPEPTGRCPNCGDLVYDGGTCCSELCHNAYAAYCSNPY